MNVTDLLRMLTSHDPDLELDAGQLREEMLAQPPFVIDIREDSELMHTGKLEGAEHIPLSSLARDVARHLRDTQSDIVLYCTSGSRSYTTARQLKQLGYERVRSLRGGIHALRREGFALVPH